MIKISKLNVFTDGGARGNPGPAAIGVCITDGKGDGLDSFGKKIGTATNNVAEYKAVIAALDWITENKKDLAKDAEINFFLDSKLVYSQIAGLFKVRDSTLRELLFFVRQKEAELGLPIVYRHIPREENKEADRFVNLALDRVGLD